MFRGATTASRQGGVEEGKKGRPTTVLPANRNAVEKPVNIQGIHVDKEMIGKNIFLPVEELRMEATLQQWKGERLTFLVLHPRLHAQVEI